MTKATTGPFCGGLKRSGGTCEQPAGWGTNHVGVGTCKLHAGSAPSAELKGQIELARRDMLVMGCPLSIEPEDAIRECIRITAGEVLYASNRIAELKAEEAVGAVETSTIRIESGEGEMRSEVRLGPPAVHVWIAVRRQAMDRLVAYSAAAARARIDERRVKIAEGQANLLVEAVRGMLVDFGVADRPDAPEIMGRHLRLLAGGIAA